MGSGSAVTGGSGWGRLEPTLIFGCSFDCGWGVAGLLWETGAVLLPRMTTGFIGAAFTSSFREVYGFGFEILRVRCSVIRATLSLGFKS